MNKLLLELKSTLQSHDSLNPKLWTDEQLDPEVWLALNKIAKEWAKFANIPARALKDIILVGGNANYNYTKHSDIDLHLVIDKDGVKCDGLVDDYLLSKKQLWALTHDITVKGQPVELYAQSESDTFKKGQGVYSLSSRRWLQQPERVRFNPNDKAVRDKVRDLETTINDLIDSKSDDIATFKRLKGKLKNMRSTAIEKGGEYAPENLAFKELRNRGVLDRMSKYIRKLEDESLTLEAYYGGEEQRKKDEKKKKIDAFMNKAIPKRTFDQFGRETDRRTGKLIEGKKKCPDGKEWDEEEGKCVKKRRPRAYYGGYYLGSDRDDDDGDTGDSGGGPPAGGGDGGGGGGE